jgi:hypothetical protein
MDHSYWNNWNFGWGWLIWFGFVFMLFFEHRKLGLYLPRASQI